MNIEYIIAIGGFIGGFIGNGFLQFIISRNDEKKKEANERIKTILENISEYGKSLYKAFNSWNEKFPNLVNGFGDYGIQCTDLKEKIDFLNHEYSDVIEHTEKHNCKFAQLCPHQIAPDELPTDVKDFCDKSKELLTEFTEKENALKSNILSAVSEVENFLSDYSDILSHFPEAYTLAKKKRNNIFSYLTQIQIANSKINISIIKIKSDPIKNIGDKENRIGNLLLNAIEKVEIAKIKIAENIK